MKNRIDKLIFLLIAIKEFAKFIHYNCKGDCFYAKHLLSDAAIDGIDGYIDDLKEVCLLGNGILPDNGYLKGAFLLLPTASKEDTENFKKLLQLIKNTLSHIDSLEDLSRADENLIGNIAEHLQKFYGLLLRQVV